MSASRSRQQRREAARRRARATPSPRLGAGTTEPSATRRSRAVEVAVIIALALGLAFVIQATLVKTYRIPSGSMEPTLAIGQRVLVNRIGMHFGAPKVGDIVVFHPPQGADETPPICDDLTAGAGTSRLCGRATDAHSKQAFIKRVVAVGGDRISVRDGHVTRNGRPERDGYIRPCSPRGFGCGNYPAIEIPKGTFFLMGDNRGGSDDARFWGPVKRSWIVGKAFVTYWPPDRIGIP